MLKSNQENGRGAQQESLDGNKYKKGGKDGSVRNYISEILASRSVSVPCSSWEKIDKPKKKTEQKGKNRVAELFRSGSPGSADKKIRSLMLNVKQGRKSVKGGTRGKKEK